MVEVFWWGAAAGPDSCHSFQHLAASRLQWTQVTTRVPSTTTKNQLPEPDTSYLQWVERGGGGVGRVPVGI